MNGYTGFQKRYKVILQKKCYYCVPMIFEKRRFFFLCFTVLFLGINLSCSVSEATQVSRHELKKQTSDLRNASSAKAESTFTINGILHSSIYANENTNHTFCGFSIFKKVFGDFSSQNNSFFLIAASSYTNFEKIKNVGKPRLYIAFLSLLI